MIIKKDSLECNYCKREIKKFKNLKIKGRQKNLVMYIFQSKTTGYIHYTTNLSIAKLGKIVEIIK
jgi:hypothetical protein